MTGIDFPNIAGAKAPIASVLNTPLLIMIAKEPESQENATPITNFLFTKESLVLFFSGQNLLQKQRAAEFFKHFRWNFPEKNPAGFTY